MKNLPSIETIRLDKEMIGATFSVSDVILNDCRAKITDVFGHCVNMQVRGFLFSEKATTYRFEAPADWWQAVKERWAPAWALRRWPVKMRTEIVDVKALYTDPRLRVSLPDYAHNLVLQRLEPQTVGQPWGEA
jgi:hypothetical protein